MKEKNYFFNFPKLLILLILIIGIFSQISSNCPLYKLIITKDINKFKLDSKYKHFYFEARGVGIIFDNSSDISLIPMQIFYEIYKFYEVAHDEFLQKIELLSNGNSQYIIIESLKPPETIHFILKDIGIKIPYNELFFSNKEEEDFVYYFRFFSNEEQENIIIGKDLIELMNITFVDNNNFVINNKDYIAKIEEE